MRYLHLIHKRFCCFWFKLRTIVCSDYKFCKISVSVQNRFDKIFWFTWMSYLWRHYRLINDINYSLVVHIFKKLYLILQAISKIISVLTLYSWQYHQLLFSISIKNNLNSLWTSNYLARNQCFKKKVYVIIHSSKTS